jgi:hypothetical protein
MASRKVQMDAMYANALPQRMHASCTQCAENFARKVLRKGQMGVIFVFALEDDLIGSKTLVKLMVNCELMKYYTPLHCFIVDHFT